MVEKWTAADEDLFQELMKRRLKIENQKRTALYDAMDECYSETCLADTVVGMIANASRVYAALEPFVLSTPEKNNG